MNDTTSGNKIPDNSENPIDFLLINKLCEPMSNVLNKNIQNITPNHITTVGLIFGIISVICLYYNKFVLSFIFFWLYYLMDCLDGYYARKYNMVTEFGDQYDHFRDVFVTLIIYILIFTKLKTTKQKVFFIIICTLFLFLSFVHLGCQEKNYNTIEKEDFLSKIKFLCLDEKNIKYTRYFGSGTNILVISLFILMLK